MTKTIKTTRTTDMLRDIGFVLAMTQKVKDEMGKPTPPPAAVAAKVAARKQIAVAA